VRRRLTAHTIVMRPALIPRTSERLLQGIPGGYSYVRFDSSPFPVSLRYRANGTRERDDDREVIVDTMRFHRVGACGPQKSRPAGLKWLGVSGVA
jgi:hypothetical protein